MGNSRATRPELKYEKGQPGAASMWQWTRQRPQATTTPTSPSGQLPAIANARLAYQAYEEVIASQRWQKLASRASQPERNCRSSASSAASLAFSLTKNS